MKAQGHFLILSVLVIPIGLALLGCKREPPAVAAIPPPVVTVSQPLEREVIDYNEYTGRTAAVEAVEVRARVSGYRGMATNRVKKYHRAEKLLEYRSVATRSV